MIASTGTTLPRQAEIALAQLPESERRLTDWPWASWNRLIDPMAPGMLATSRHRWSRARRLWLSALRNIGQVGHKVVFAHYELTVR